VGRFTRAWAIPRARVGNCALSKGTSPDMLFGA
jgi:hypothetical protein